MVRKSLPTYSALPGFGLTIGITLFGLGLMILLPLGGLVLFAAKATPGEFLRAATSPQVMAAYKLSFGTAACAAAVDALGGFLVAWVLVRYSFPGKRLIDALIDLPFALPTAVSGIALTAVYSENGWLGRPLAALGVPVAYTPLGIGVALTFIGLPFAVRTLQPAIAELDPELEEAAAILGAGRAQTFVRVLVPMLLPAVITAYTLAFARALGEYGSVVFIAGNVPMSTEIAPLLIVNKLEQYDYLGAAAVAVMMLFLSFVLLLLINVVQRYSRRYDEQEE